MLNNSIICAFDNLELDVAVRLASELKGVVGAAKLGLEFFTSYGRKGVEQIRKTGIPVFLDLKFHDIPNTVAGAVSAAVQMDIAMMTIHTLGGSEMLRAAMYAAADTAAKLNKERPLIVGVTVLTSMDNEDMRQIGVESSVDSIVSTLAGLAMDNNLDGCVCSSHEIGRIRDNFGGDLKLVVPGIRPKGTNLDDQKRIMTPEEAIRQGADFLVIGRPITRSQDPVKAAISISESL